MTYSPFEIHGADRPGRWLITCDHASNHVPTEINDGDLGIAPEDMARHIAYDIGARGVSLRLGELLDAPVVCSRFSRLVIDPNRGVQDPTLIMRLYDGTIIPANGEIDAAEEQRRIESYYAPYHNAVAELAARREDTIVVSVHSFSPKLRGRAPRPWQVGVLHAPHDPKSLGPHFIDRLRQEDDLCVGDNEPYAGHLPGDAVDQHALQHGRLNTLIELRQDLITDETGQQAWAERLAPALHDMLHASGY